MEKLQLFFIKTSQKLFFMSLSKDYYYLINNEEKTDAWIYFYSSKINNMNIIKTGGFQKTGLLSFCGFDKTNLTFLDSSAFSNIETLIFSRCCDKAKLSFLDTKNFNKLKNISIHGCCLKSTLTITDIRFFNKVEKLSIKNCGNYDKGIYIVDEKHYLDGEKAYLLLKTLSDDINNNGSGEINIKVQNLQNSQELSELWEKLIRKEWTVDIKI